MNTTRQTPYLHDAQGFNPESLGLAFVVTYWMWAVWPPIILVAGTFGNIVSLFILQRLNAAGGSTINVYLSALAVSDLIMIHSSLLRYWFLEVFGYEIYWHRVLCKVGMWLLGAAWNNSAYLLVALTLQRVISVVWPHRVHIICTRRKSWTVVGGIAVLSLLLLAHIPYGYDVVYKENGTQVQCGHGSPEYSLFNSNIWVYVEIVTFALFPFLCLLISNGILAFKLGQSVRAAGTALAAGRSGQVDERKKKTSSTTVTVMAMSLVFVVLNLPLFVHLIVHSTHNFDTADQIEVQYTGLDYFLQSFVVILLCCNFAVNFYLYCLTGTRFRNEFKKLVCGQPCSKSASLTNTTIESGVTKNTWDEF